MNVLNVEFLIPLGDEVRFDTNICQERQFMKIFTMIRVFFIKWSRSSKIMKNVISDIKL